MNVNDDYYIKIILHGRIHNKYPSIIIDNKICKRIQDYTLYPIENGHLLFYLKRDHKGNIDYNHYINNHHQNKFEIIYIKNGIFNKLFEEELDIKLYLQTLLKNDYTKFTSNIYVIKNRRLPLNIGSTDILFYSSQLYLLSKFI